MAIHDQIEELARKHGATSYRNRADTQNPAYGFTPAGLLNLLAEVTGEIRKQDEALIRQMLEALETCDPGDTSTGHVIYPSYSESEVDEAITAARLRLESKP